MSRRIAVSSHGIVSFGDTFVDAQGIQPPATFRFVPKHHGTHGIAPDLITFTAFGTCRSVRGENVKSSQTEEGKRVKKVRAYESGSHAALYYKNSGSFFSVLLVRCDTWAVQWAVENFSDKRTVSELHALSAHTVVGVCVDEEDKKSLFVASRFDTRFVTKQDNRLWRQFMAKPRLVELQKLDGDIAAVAAVDSSSVVVLTTAGSLLLVTVSLSAGPNKSHGYTFTEQLILIKGFHGVGKASQLSFFSSTSNEGENHMVASYTHGQNTFEVALFHGALHEAKGKAVPINVAATYAINQVTFCGASQLCVLLDGGASTAAVQFAVIDLGGEVTSLSAPVTLPCSPVASVFNGKKQTQTLICAGGIANKVSIESMVHTTLPLTPGPYTQTDVAKAVWKPLHDPYKSFGPRTVVEKSEAGELFRDLQMLGDHSGATETSGHSGAWIPLELFYCLANKNGAEPTDKSDVAVFSVKTAPFLHTRLIKQWHNATNGLKQLLQSGGDESVPQNPFTLAWHPRHLRRALRLMNQDELASTFRNAVSTARTSTYAETATSAVDTGLQIVSLSRQSGAFLAPQDVQTIAVLLRASRSVGHESLRYGSRMGLLLESTLQQRRMNRLLRQNHSASGKEEEGDAAGVGTPSLGSDFFGVPTELQTMRALQTRYTANTWTQPLREKIEQHRSVAARAAEYMKETASSLSPSVAPLDHPTTWADTGSRSHGDSILEHFESTLMAGSHPMR